MTTGDSVPTKPKKHRYRQVGGKRLIEVRIKSSQQLFDARDPAPFRERDLDDDFVYYVVSAAREFSYGTPLKLVIHTEEKESESLSFDAIREAIESYWNYQIEVFDRELSGFFKQAQIFMLIGVLILITCILVAQSIGNANPPGLLGVLREGIIIFGWVSMWKPIELMLFDWYPLYEKLRLFRKLLGMEVEVAVAQPVVK